MNKIHLIQEDKGENWRGFSTLESHFNKLLKSLESKMSLYNNLMSTKEADEEFPGDFGLSEEKKLTSNLAWVKGMQRTILGVKCIVFMLKNINQ